MGKHFQTDYTTRARRFAAKYPLLTSVLTHINFWALAYILLVIIFILSRHSLVTAYSLPIDLKLWPSVLSVTILAVIYGTGDALLDHYLDKSFFRNKPLGKLILFKAMVSLALMITCFLLLRFVLFDLIVAPALNFPDSMNTDVTWKDLFYIALIYNGVMTVLLGFILQMNKKFGPGVLVPLLLGKYRNPREEERIFMFMDLKSSTTIAEQLGHIKYSAFIRDAFVDINQILNSYHAEIYQYVGDEIVVCWKIEDGLKNMSCVHFFFACEKQFTKRKEYYQKNYGMLPEFKASLHLGKVTAVEIGEVKRDIAYHGDTINTAARIQGMCNEYQKKLLVSDLFSEMSKLNEHFKTQELGNIMLKGKTTPVGILSVEN